MGIFSWVVAGLVVGFLASVFSKRRGVRVLTMLLAGVFGAVLGGMDAAFLYKVPGAIQGFNLVGLLVASVGAFFAVALVGLLTPQKSPAV